MTAAQSNEPRTRVEPGNYYLMDHGICGFSSSCSPPSSPAGFSLSLLWAKDNMKREVVEEHPVDKKYRSC